MTKKMPLILFALGLSTALPAFASTPHDAWAIDLSHGNGAVEFDATGHPSALKIVGKGAAPSGALQIKNGRASGIVSFDLTTLDTGISMRTRHMKEKYLETGKYPQAKLSIARIDLPKGTPVDHLHADALPFNGTLSLHGIEKPVAGTAQIQADGSKVSIAAHFSLKVSDYGIKIPSFAGITMTDEVAVSVTDSAPIEKGSTRATTRTRP